MALFRLINFKIVIYLNSHVISDKKTPKKVESYYFKPEIFTKVLCSNSQTAFSFFFFFWYFVSLLSVI